MIAEQPTATATALKPNRRIEIIDILRGLALLAMATYHFTWDLEFFGYARAGLTAFGPWKIYARCIASTFLFLVGVSLVLAHGRGIRWPGFWKRLGMIVAAALAITAVTYFATPDSFIFFGILHQIALASVLGLAFLRVPALLSLLIAALVIAAPHYLRSSFFDHPALQWVGLSTVDPRSNDYVPLFPWFGVVLAGMSATALAASTGLLARLAEIPHVRWTSPLTFIGRHSLAFYLIHQPALIACVWLFSQILPPEARSPQTNFTEACQASCANTRDAAFCTRYCGCMLGRLEKGGMLDSLYKGGQDAALQQRVRDLASTCTAETDGLTGQDMAPTEDKP
ncbi:DUF1624 domain-containing protein [Mesorhizobium sp. SP-1A]|uniref:heparan-alpha-glucosaminide N-acetyltransferase n=1 Tax=Mesorhizobium sp. SP-1A TaxID=3077840 RepID=UPI0028F6CF6D|nr:DUF1624 domain-containing protein [Mesorhizobium sp. SP-1A]